MVQPTECTDKYAPKELSQNTNIDFLLDPSIEFNGRDYKYICDSSLYRVGKHIRMLGLDCIYESDINSNYLLFLARRDNRIILTKNRGMVKQIVTNKQQYEDRIERSKQVKIDTIEVQAWKKEKEERLRKEREQYEYDFEEEEEEDSEEENEPPFDYKFYFVSQKQNTKMIEEVVNMFKIKYIPEKVFSLCLKCNNRILPVEKESVKNDVFESVFNKYSEFFRCTNCSKVYWGADSRNQSYATAIKFAKQYSYEDENKETEF